eukprot:CAMPEP_0174728774 /NCGR_PEP_ID=MMETSP1094-20130205/52399_1 /TAXON_ID=156173 /ORGANISM="Chrysochromulina brevifilum, Strain UTEX LB 985" /LENGTH=68 /DNA_ID=CAMNT_0015930763 /DNA_START=759 /DNA_END=965 /DNA_ORIENTATION=+
MVQWAARLMISIGHNSVERTIEHGRAEDLVARRNLLRRLWQDLFLDHLEQTPQHGCASSEWWLTLLAL